MARGWSLHADAPYTASPQGDPTLQQLTEQRPGCRQHLEIQRHAQTSWLTELPTLVIFLFFTIHEFNYYSLLLTPWIRPRSEMAPHCQIQQILLFSFSCLSFALDAEDQSLCPQLENTPGFPSTYLVSFAFVSNSSLTYPLNAVVLCASVLSCFLFLLHILPVADLQFLGFWLPSSC